jgi:hypothetical protein
VGAVDPDDDTIDRWIAWHFRYDDVRRERRNTTLAAFDNARDFEQCLHSERERLHQRQASGEAEAFETISGVFKAAGHRASMQRRGHVLEGSRRDSGRGSRSKVPFGRQRSMILS